MSSTLFFKERGFRRPLAPVLTGINSWRAQREAIISWLSNIWTALHNAERVTVGTALRSSHVQVVDGANIEAIAGPVQTLSAARQQAELTVVRGLVALEEGDNDLAKRSFEAALSLGDGPKFQFESRPVAVKYLDLLTKASLPEGK